jgi:hypothetical protein
MDVELRSPRTMQGVATAAVLLGFVADVRVVPLLAAIALVATFVRMEPTFRITWATEIGLLVVATLLFVIGRAGWGWVLSMLAAGVAALAAMADVWILPDRDLRAS